MDHKLRRKYHHPCTRPESPGIWLLFRIRTSLADREPVFQCILTGLLKAGVLVVAQNISIQAAIIHMVIEAKRHFVHVHPLGMRRYQIYVLCFCYRQMTLGHGTREIQWLWSHHDVRVCSKIVPSRGRWSQGLHLFPKWEREPRGSQHTCNLCRLGGQCLGKRLEAIFNSGRVLQEER